MYDIIIVGAGPAGLFSGYFRWENFTGQNRYGQNAHNNT